MTDTLNRRQGVPAVHRRPVGRRGVRRDARRREPGHRRGRRRPSRRRASGRRPRRRRGREAFETWSLTTPQTRSLALLKIADILDANADELGRLESSQTGKPTGAADRRDDDVVRPVPLLRRRLPGHGGPRGHRVPRGPHLDGPPRPGRGRRVDRPVELPAVHGGLEARARRSRPATRSSSSRPPARRSRALRFAELIADELPDGRAQRARRLRRGDGRPARRAPEGPDGLDHRRHGDRQAHRGDRGGHRQAAPPRARRQGPGHRVRRRRRRAGGRDHQVGRLLEQRPGLHRGLPRDRRPGGLRQLRRRPHRTR